MNFGFKKKVETVLRFVKRFEVFVESEWATDVRRQLVYICPKFWLDILRGVAAALPFMVTMTRVSLDFLVGQVCPVCSHTDHKN